jgi:hypothetical protein
VPVPPANATVAVNNIAPPPITFENSTGPKGRRRRKETRGKTSRPKQHHAHSTRANSRRQATAANLEVVPSHWALHGNAFNPDTGKLAQCKELSQSSDGAHWRRGNSQEIGRLAQGLGKLDPTIKGTNTMFLFTTRRSQKTEKSPILT